MDREEIKLTACVEIPESSDEYPVLFVARSFHSTAIRKYAGTFFSNPTPTMQTNSNTLRLLHCTAPATASVAG